MGLSFLQTFKLPGVWVADILCRSEYIQRAMSDDPKNPEYYDDGDGDVAVVTKTRQKTKKPNLYKVLLHNDDYTSMEFVVLVLSSVFHLEENRAVEVMLHVHTKGVGVAGVYSYEVAETKVKKTMSLAREHEYPLRCSMEPE